MEINGTAKCPHCNNPVDLSVAVNAELALKDLQATLKKHLKIEGIKEVDIMLSTPGEGLSGI